MTESNNEDDGVVGRRDDRRETPQQREARETKLVALCIRGHRDALRSLILDYADDVTAGAKKTLHEAGRPISGDVNDVIQEFWADLLSCPLRLLGRFDASHGPLAPWLATAGYLHGKHFIRKHSFRSSPVVAAGRVDLDALPGPSTLLISAEQLLNRLVGQLSSTSGSIVDQYYGRGTYAIPKKVAEIAAQLGVSESSVYRKLTIIHRRMWEELELEGVHRPPKRRRKPAHDP